MTLKENPYRENKLVEGFPRLEPKKGILVLDRAKENTQKIKRALQEKGFLVTGTANNYEDGKRVFLEGDPGFILLDVKLAGERTGADFARFIQTQEVPSPFIFSGEKDEYELALAAKETCPEGFLCKPVDDPCLLANMEIALYKHRLRYAKKLKISFYEGNTHFKVDIHDILYLTVDHVYVVVHLERGKKIMHRGSLANMLTQLPMNKFLQTHRSFVVNVSKISHWNYAQVFVNDTGIPISRSRRKAILNRLKMEENSH